MYYLSKISLDYICLCVWICFNKDYNVFCGENIINTLSGSCFDDKMAVCLCFYHKQKTGNLSLFVHMYLEINKYMVMAWPC